MKGLEKSLKLTVEEIPTGVEGLIQKKKGTDIIFIAIFNIHNCYNYPIPIVDDTDLEKKKSELGMDEEPHGTPCVKQYYVYLLHVYICLDQKSPFYRY